MQIWKAVINVLSAGILSLISHSTEIFHWPWQMLAYIFTNSPSDMTPKTQTDGKFKHIHTNNIGKEIIWCSKERYRTISCRICFIFFTGSIIFWMYPVIFNSNHKCFIIKVYSGRYINIKMDAACIAYVIGYIIIRHISRIWDKSLSLNLKS